MSSSCSVIGTPRIRSSFTDGPSRSITACEVPTFHSSNSPRIFKNNNLKFYFCGIKPLLSSKDIFADLLPLCKDANDIINEVLPNNERIMEQFIRDLFLGKVQVECCIYLFGIIF